MIQTVNKYPIDEIFKSDSELYYFIPKYQREYTWGYNDWYNLYSDLLENDEGYFFGSIICINTGDSTYPRLEVIDGQQRLTTLCMFLAAIYTKMRAIKKDDDEDMLVDIVNLRKSLVRKNNKENGLVLVPQVQSNNLDDFNYVMKEAGLISFATKKPYWGQHKMARCFHYYQELLDRELNKVDEYDQKVNFLTLVRKKLMHAMLVKIEVSTASDAYILFESLNNRGTPLTAIDLIKNLIMARAEKSGFTTDDCFSRWQSLLGYLTEDYATQERFFRQYYNAFKNRLNEPFRTTDDKKKDPLGYIATKSNLLNIYERIINRDLKSFLDDILVCGEIYSHFIRMNGDTDEESKALKDLAHIQAVNSYMLLMYLEHEKINLQLDTNILVRIMNLLTIYFVRRNTTDYPGTRDLIRIFMEIISNIENDENIKGKKVYDYIREYLGDSERCADDEFFERKLRGDIYKDNSGMARFLLCALAEKHMTSEKWTDLWKRNDHNVYIWSIEHIFPEGENIPQDWVNMIANGDKEKASQYLNDYAHKLGNLTITGYNSALSNFSFERKRDRMDKKKENYIGYKNGLEINKELANKESWTVEDIKNRTDKMVEELLEMFKFPNN